MGCLAPIFGLHCSSDNHATTIESFLWATRTCFPKHANPNIRNIRPNCSTNAPNSCRHGPWNTLTTQGNHGKSIFENDMGKCMQHVPFYKNWELHHCRPTKCQLQIPGLLTRADKSSNFKLSPRRKNNQHLSQEHKTQLPWNPQNPSSCGNWSSLPFSQNVYSWSVRRS